MKKRIVSVLVFFLIMAINYNCTQERTKPVLVHSQKFVSTFDFALIKINGDTYKRLSDNIQLLTKEKWEIKYIASQKILLLSQLNKEADSKTKEVIGIQLKEGLNKLPGSDSLYINWGFLLGDKDKTILFPTGEIYILFDKNLKMDERKKLLSSYKYYKIKYFDDIKVKQPPLKHTFWEGKEFIPEYVKEGIKQGIKVPEIYSRNEKDTVIACPFAVIKLPSRREHETFIITAEISKLKGVSFASPGFHALGKDLLKLNNNNPPPSVSGNFITNKNFIRRSWELFYPCNDVFNSSYPDKFLCSDLLTADFDDNFFDHNYIRQSIIGYDAYDNDLDPRTPLYPPDINIHTDLSYIHGIEMSATIGGFAQTPGWECGVAPGTFIVPFRPLAIDNIDLTTREGTDQFIRDFASDWWNSLFRLYVISSEQNVTVANFSGTTNEIIFEYTHLDDWMKWFLQQGNYGYGIFFVCSAGNNSEGETVAFPASMDNTFAVGWGNKSISQVLGNHGPLLDITVDDGRWPMYSPISETIYIEEPGSGGTSVSSAVVSGTATLLRKAGTVSIDNAAELASVLRFSAQFTQSQFQEINNDGFHNEFGYGFLDAFHATKIAYKDFMPPMKAQKITFLSDKSSCLLINAGFPSYSRSFPNHSSGMFWCLKQVMDDQGVYWKHLRLNENTRHSEIVIDPLSPMGTSVVGDYDGDGFDEIALQMGYWTEHPEYYFLVRKFNQGASDWERLGQDMNTFPYAQFMLPNQNTVSQVVSALLEGGAQAEIAAIQGKYINAVKYDKSSNLWKSFGQQNQDISGLPAYIKQTIGDYFYTSIKTKQIQMFPFLNYHERQTLLVISIVERKNLILFWLKPKRYVITSLLSYNPVSSSFENIPFTSSGATHSIIAEPDDFSVPGVRIDDFDGDKEPEALVIEPCRNKNLFLLDFNRTGPVDSETLLLNTFSSLKAGVTFNVESGDVNGDGHAELAFLSGIGNNNSARFLSWDAGMHTWNENINSLSLNRKNNRATRLLVGDFNSDGISEVGMLLEKPHNNIFAVYQMQNGIFREYGLW